VQKQLHLQRSITQLQPWNRPASIRPPALVRSQSRWSIAGAHYKHWATHWEFTFSRMDWLSHLCFHTHEHWHLWFCFLTYRLTLSHMRSLAWAFSPMDPPSHAWSDSLNYAFSHERSHLWNYLPTYGLTLSPLLSDAWAFSPMDLPCNVWINSLTSGFTRMSLFTYESTFSRMHWLSHNRFLTLEPFQLWICFLTYALTLSHILSRAWAFSRMNLPSHVWIDTLTYAFGRMSLLTYESAFSRMDCLSQLCFLTH